MISSGKDGCYNDVCRNLGVDLLPRNTRTTVNDLIQHLMSFRIYPSVHVLRARDIMVVEKERPRTRRPMREVRLYNIDDHISLGALLEPAAHAFYPPNPVRSR